MRRPLASLVLLLAACGIDRGGRSLPPDASARDDAAMDAAPARDAGEPPDATRDAARDARADTTAADADAEPADAGPRDASCSGDVRVCDGDDLVGCVAGRIALVERCDLGCDARERRCHALVPANVEDPAWLLESDADVVLGAAGSPWTIDTDDGSIRGADGTVVREDADASGIVLRAQPQVGAAPELAVFSLGSLRVEEGATVVARGSRALVLLAAGDVVIDGVLDVGAALDGNRATPGPGGAPGGAARTSAGGPGSGERGDDDFALESGGGGGGNGGRGGAGGDSTDLTRTVRGGVGGDDFDGSSPLRGGGGGGGGATGDSGGAGGSAGGALQITARRSITVSATGIVRAPGAGGAGAAGFGGGGGGGGAGGTILLEAPALSVEGRVAANGGGGGGGREGLGTDDGDRGGDGPERAAGGDGPGAFTGDGGGGGAGAELGGSSADRANNPGGGGGGAGRVVLRALEPLPELFAGVSPSVAPGAVVQPVQSR